MDLYRLFLQFRQNSKILDGITLKRRKKIFPFVFTGKLSPVGNGDKLSQELPVEKNNHLFSMVPRDNKHMF